MDELVFVAHIEWGCENGNEGPDDRFTIFIGRDGEETRAKACAHILMCAAAREMWEEWFGLPDVPQWDMTNPADVDDMLNALEDSGGMAPIVELWEATIGGSGSYLPR